MNYILLIICSIILQIVSLKHIKPRLCVNCKYFLPDNDSGSGKYGKCSLFHRKEGKINYLVTGINKSEYYYCSTSRETNDMCGEEGKCYKKKIVKNGDNK